MTTPLTDLRFALRRLARAPGFVATSVLLLGLALGTNACVFSVVYGLLYKPLPYPNAERLVTLGMHEVEQNVDFGLSPPIFNEIAAHPAPLQSVAAYWPTSLGLTDTADSRTQLVQAMRAQPRLFDMLGVHPAIGRGLVDKDATSDLDGNVLVSWEFAEAHFGHAENAIGKNLSFKYLKPHPIVGVLPKGFHFVGEPQVWLALKFSDNELSNALWFGGLQAIADLDPSANATGAALAMTALVKQIPRVTESPLSRTLALRIDPLRRVWLGDRTSALRLMQIAAALLMLVTLANVCNLYLVRLSARQHEMALLACLGADPRRRLRLAAMETLAIGASGTMAGFALYPLGLSLLRHFDLLPTDVPQPIAIDAAVLVYTLLLAAIAVAAMLACAIRFAGRSDKVYEALKQGGTRQTASRATQRVRRSLIVAQIALTATLLTGTGLLLRSAQRLLAQDVGFDREHIVLAPVYFEPDQLDEKETDRVYRAILQSLLERAAALPGVDAAGLGARTPFDGENIETNFEPPQRSAADSGAAQHAKSYSNVGPGFFAALGLPLVAGRAFSTDEVNNNDPNIVVVDDFFAHHYFPDGDALGQTFRLQNPEGGPRQTHAVRIVGVTVATRGNTLDEALDRPTIYEPGNHNNTIILHTRIDPAALNRSLRNLLHDISPKAEFGDITTMRARIASTLDERTRLNTLLALLGAIALALAAIGLYAVLAYSVRQRWGEFGVRMALGATSLRVLREVLLHGVRLVGIGLIVGLPLAYAFAQMLSAQLYRIDSLDPTTLIAVAALLVSIGLAASWLPARNAARVDPITALRQE